MDEIIHTHTRLRRYYLSKAVRAEHTDERSSRESLRGFRIIDISPGEPASGLQASFDAPLLQPCRGAFNLLGEFHPIGCPITNPPAVCIGIGRDRRHVFPHTQLALVVFVARSVRGVVIIAPCMRGEDERGIVERVTLRKSQMNRTTEVWVRYPAIFSSER